MKHRFVLGIMALLVVGSLTTVQAGTTTDAPEVVDQYWVNVPAGVTSFRIGYATPETDVYQVVFTPRKPLVYGFKEIRPGTGWLRFSRPTESAVRIDYSVLRYSP